MTARAFTHDNRRYVKLRRMDCGCTAPLPALGLGSARLPEGVSAMLAMSVRMFLVAIVVFAVAALAFLIATA